MATNSPRAIARSMSRTRVTGTTPGRVRVTPRSSMIGAVSVPVLSAASAMFRSPRE
jgi:hypothetical protein